MLCIVGSLRLFSNLGQDPQEELHAAEAVAGFARRTSARPGASARPTVALCFFGLTRSLTHTHPGIRANLLAPLRQAGYEVDVFLHTYNLTMLQNSRSSEAAVLNQTEWELLQPRDHEISDQAQFLREVRDKFQGCQRPGSGWPHDPHFQNLRNVMCQLNSVHRVSLLWQRHHQTRRYHAVIYARPDVLFDCPLPVSYLHNLQENTLYLPDHSQYGGLNDRFAMGRPDVAIVYGNRLSYLFSKCRSVPVHAERYVAQMAKDLRLGVVQMPDFHFYRVRATGEVAHADLIAMLGCHPDRLEGLPISSSVRDAVLAARKRLRARPGRHARPGRRLVLGGVA